ncbi:centrosomal protein of 162 kDa-like [Notothenia coriiceps]|uniref:Centrosomal protein of 162 kDa n=1 Tax=Notothenia coriiceps TaxID=8208 RepID=A0A6I9PLC4_9TELE|nr:PREDICTED: centrosomal protein of 162 kDa-like [Notothenia coriiceps]
MSFNTHVCFPSQLRYEQQISELEQQLEPKLQLDSGESAEGAELWRSQVQTLQAELEQVKQSHQKVVKSLQEQRESLQQQLKHKPQPSPGRHQRQAKAASGLRIERLNKDLALKTQSVQELSRTVDRLQRERSRMLSAPPPAESKRPAAKSLSSAAGGETFPAAQYEKTYQPIVFTGSESDTHDIVDDIGYMPCRFEPYASESGETNSESDSGDDNPPNDRQIPLDLQRLNNVEWCTCGYCRADNLETVQECVCCRELAKVQALNGNHGGSCITQHPGFEAVCLNEYVLDVAYSYYKQNHGHLNKSPHEYV